MLLQLEKGRRNWKKPMEAAGGKLGKLIARSPWFSLEKLLSSHFDWRVTQNQLVILCHAKAHIVKLKFQFTPTFFLKWPLRWEQMLFTTCQFHFFDGRCWMQHLMLVLFMVVDINMHFLFGFNCLTKTKWEKHTGLAISTLSSKLLFVCYA